MAGTLCWLISGFSCCRQFSFLQFDRTLTHLHSCSSVAVDFGRAWNFNSRRRVHSYVFYGVEPTGSMVGLVVVLAGYICMVCCTCHVCSGFIQGQEDKRVFHNFGS